MRILHTADWHIGQKLHERQRLDEHEAFLNWLLQTIQEQNVELLLVAGDVFDTSLPSAEATNLYYRFLYKLYEGTDAYAVIIAGNHDSPRHLDAPREFLKMGRIHVVGHASEPDNCVIPIPDDNPKLFVGAVPYFSENVLSHIPFESESDKSERYREKHKVFYSSCVSLMATELPKILMGHLFVQGGSVSGSERKIQGEQLNDRGPSLRIGGASPLVPEDFPDAVDYVALGHLHRPQQIKGSDYPIRYAGSPIPLKFNEAYYTKKVYLFEFSDDGKLVSDDEIDVPVFKELCTVEGNDTTVLNQAMTEDWNGKYIQVKLKLDDVKVGINDSIRQAFQDRGGDVLSVEIELPQEKDRPQINMEEMKRPEDVFTQYHKVRFGDVPDESMQQTFIQLLQMVEENR